MQSLVFQPQSAKDKAKKKGPSEALPANVEEWASYECPDEIRDALKQDSSGCAMNRETILAPVSSISRFWFVGATILSS